VQPARHQDNTSSTSNACLVRRLAIAGIATLLLAGLAPVTQAGATGDPSHRRPAPLIGAPVSGNSAYVGGPFIWTGYPYRDHDVTYPKGVTNGANLVQVQLSLEGGYVHVRIVLETLLDTRVPVIGMAFDTDENPATGAPSLPGGRWKPAGPLGVEDLALLTSGGGRLLRWNGARWREGGSFAVRSDVTTDTVEATLPLAPGPTTWRVFGVAGAADSAGHSWVDGAQPISDAAFVGGEVPANWQHARSDAVLAGQLDSSVAAATVNWGEVAAGASGLAAGSPATEPGFHTLVYRSGLDLGEGIGTATITRPGGEKIPVGNLYAGPYQPYLVWVPPHLPTRPPLVVYMHGFTQTHLDNAASFGPPAPNPTPAALLLGNGGFAPPAVVAFPLGRGENTFYFGPAEQDVLDVTNDALARFGADPNRVVLSGVSMGGFGTYRLGVRYPDRWSALVPFIGTGGSPQYEFGAVPQPVLDQVFSPIGFPTGNAELLENLVNLPIRMVNGQIDPIVNNVLVTQDTLRFQQLGYDYRAWVLARRQHEVVPSLSNCVLLEALGHQRAADPPRVVLSVEPSMFERDPSTGLDLHYDHAWWVSGVTVRNGVAKGTIDVTSLARSDRSSAATQVIGAGQNLTSGADLCGPNPAVHTGDAWREQGLVTRPVTPQPVVNGLNLSVSGVSNATIDLQGATVAVDRSMLLRVVGDGTSALRLVGPWTGPVQVLRDGRLVAVLTPTGGSVTLRANFTGAHDWTLLAR
jgi:pimeloyl-ACP methyl ester carboxylesterase